MESTAGFYPVKSLVYLEEYIPLKVVLDDGKDEPLKAISYNKDNTSLLEIAVGMTSGMIKRVTLLLSKEYDILDRHLNVFPYETSAIRLPTEGKNNCSDFKTHIFLDGVEIIISKEKPASFIRMDRLFIGLSSSNSITGICLCQLTSDEKKHIINELNYQ